MTTENLKLNKNAIGLNDHAQLPVELQDEVQALVKQSKQRSKFTVRQVLKVMDISPSSYYRWHCRDASAAPTPRISPGTLYRLLPCQRQAIIDYALKHPDVRHRELAFKMLDEGICGVLPSSVYRVLD